MKEAQAEACGRRAFFAESTRSRNHGGFDILGCIIAAQSVVDIHSPAVSGGGERSEMGLEMVVVVVVSGLAMGREIEV